MAITSKFLKDIRESAEAEVADRLKKATEGEEREKKLAAEGDEEEMKLSEVADEEEKTAVAEASAEGAEAMHDKEIKEGEGEEEKKAVAEADAEHKADEMDEEASEEEGSEGESDEKSDELKEEEDAELADDEEEKLSSEEEKDVKEAADALTKDEELPESFKTKVASIFEAAVKRAAKKRADAHKKKLVESYNKKLETTKNKVSETLVNKVDGYLDYVVEEWMKDNKVAIEGALRSEITEKFIVGLKNLFESHYIEVPAEKANILSEQEQKIKKLESELNNELVKSVELRKENIRLKKSSIIKKLTEGMTVSDAAKFQELCEGVSFENTQSFGQKLKVIKETYFPKTSSGSRDIDASLLTEGGLTHTEEPKITTEVDVFASAISRMVKR